MKIAVISDSHDNLPNLRKAVSFIENEGIEIILHCGDVCTSSTLKDALGNFKGKVYVVFGNVDGDHFKITEFTLKELSHIKILGESGELKIGGKKIAFCHLPEFARGLASTQKYDLVFYGHTHKPWEEKVYNTRLINPGNLAGLFYKATFAIYDTETDEVELKILEKLK